MSTPEEAYSIYCAFDLQKHKAYFTNYLEVIVLPSGEVVYAVPSHVEKLTELACLKLGVTREELSDMCPKKYTMTTCGGFA